MPCLYEIRPLFRFSCFVWWEMPYKCALAPPCMGFPGFALIYQFNVALNQQSLRHVWLGMQGS